MVLDKPNAVWLVHELSQAGFEGIKTKEPEHKLRVYKADGPAAVPARRFFAAPEPRTPEWALEIRETAERIKQPFQHRKWNGWAVTLEEMVNAIDEHGANRDQAANHIGRAMKKLDGWRHIQIIQEDGRRVRMYFRR